ncbi:MAG: glutamate--tRNA ligase, partial [Allomuricauda sp.]
DSGEPYVIRFKTPQDQLLELQDSIRGTIKIDTNVLDDKILFKSDGMPTCRLANIVDDHLMEISHVIRGEEWLPSLPLHQLLYDSFGWKAPEFAHLPLIMKPEGKGKLSKRDGEKGGFPIFPLSWNDSEGYREAGYFPEAVVNFLALLGWNPGTEQEIFDLPSLVDSFSLDRVNKSGARFDPEKTRWYNHHYLQQKSNEGLASDLMPILAGQMKTDKLPDKAYVTTMVKLIKERADFTKDLWELGNFFFQTPTSYNEKAVKKQWKEDTSNLMIQVANLISETNDWSSSSLESNIKTWITDNELSFGRIMGPLRLLLVGDLKGPHLFDIIALLGKKESINRIELGIKALD